MFCRRLIKNTPSITHRTFTSSPVACLKAGDKVPSAKLYDSSPANSVDLRSQTSEGKYIVVGVPGAFSPGCSGSHVPGYWKAFDKFSVKGVDKIFVVTVNDAFVTGEWAKAFESQLGSSNPGIKFLADPFGEFSKEWDVSFDASKFFGNERSKRYAAIVKDGEVTETFIEPDATGIDVSAADKVLCSV